MCLQLIANKNFLISASCLLLQSNYFASLQVLKTSPSSIGAVTTGGGNIQTVTNVPSMNDCEALLSQIFTQTGLPLNGAQVAAAAAAATAGLPTAFGLATAAAGTSFTKSANGNPANKGKCFFLILNVLICQNFSSCC